VGVQSIFFFLYLGPFGAGLCEAGKGHYYPITATDSGLKSDFSIFSPYQLYPCEMAALPISRGEHQFYLSIDDNPKMSFPRRRDSVGCATRCSPIQSQVTRVQKRNLHTLRFYDISTIRDYTSVFLRKLPGRCRRIVWQESIQDVIKYSHEKPVICRLEKLLAA
jgi:hypothetical protein